MVPALEHPSPLSNALKPARDRYFDDTTRNRIHWTALAALMFVVSLLILVEGSRGRWLGPPTPTEVSGLLTRDAMPIHIGGEAQLTGGWTILCADDAECAHVLKTIGLTHRQDIRALSVSGEVSRPIHGFAVVDPFGRHFATLPAALSAGEAAGRLTSLVAYFERDISSRRY